MATYLILDLVVLALLGVWVCAARVLSAKKGVWQQAAVLLAGLLVLTIVFDNLIIAAHIVSYDPARILGLTIGNVPIEDLGYAIGAVIMVPLFWSTMRGRK